MTVSRIWDSHGLQPHRVRNFKLSRDIFAALLLTGGNFLGLRVGLIDEQDIYSAKDQKIQIIQVVDGSPAQQADVRLLDEIINIHSLRGETVKPQKPKDIQDFVAGHSGEKILMVVRQNGKLLEKEVLVRSSPPAGEGPLGISMALTGVVVFPWYTAIWKGFADAGILAANTVYGFYSVFKTLFLQGKIIAVVDGLELDRPRGLRDGNRILRRQPRAPRHKRAETHSSRLDSGPGI